MSAEISLTFSILTGPDADLEQSLDLASSLRDELLEGPVLSVQHERAGQAPAFSKGPGGLTPDLVVTVAAAALPALIVLVQSWMLRRQGQTVRVKIKEVEIEIPRGASPEEIERLVKIVEKTAKKVK